MYTLYILYTYLCDLNPQVKIPSVTYISTKKKLEGDPTIDYGNVINDFLFSMLNNGEIDISVYDYLYNIFATKIYTSA